MTRPIADHFIALLAAVVATAGVGCIVQTQLNIAALEATGAAVGAGMLGRVLVEDLARLGPVMMGIAAAALVPGMLITRFVARAGSPLRYGLYAAVGVAALWTTFQLLSMVTPMPALVVATGTPTGLLCVSLSGAVGGWAYAWMSRSADATSAPDGRAGSRRPARTLGAGAVLVLVPAVAFVAMRPREDAQVPLADPARYAVQTVASGLQRPWSVAPLADGRMLVTEMAGRLLILGPQGARTEIGLEGLPGLYQRGGTTGLMDVATDPDFSTNRWLYLTMGYGQEGANGTRLVRARLDGDRIADVRVLFSSTPKSTDGSNGGRLAFLGDGTLVLSLGDGTAHRIQAQDPGNHIGKLVRIDLEGRVPPDNPYVGRPGAAPHVLTLGHKNVQGIAFDTATGTLLIAEHGARGGDEVNVVQSGGNYGWPIVTQGIDYSFARVTPFERLDGFVDPILRWTPSIAPAGLAVYNAALFPQWQGSLLVAALKDRSLRRVMRRDGRIVGQERLLSEIGERLRDVRVAADGTVLVLTDGQDAKLLRLTPVGPS